jgi:23S rRNA (cytidine1920-2'-O)/16S rRNA (cytidine1409-2'-O)-methyltransferase
VDRGLAETRARAQDAITAGRVFADGRKITKSSQLIEETAELTAEPAHPWVGRGALKLDHALTLWPMNLTGRVVLDIGASTGGFTEVALSRGARLVYAVDVGRGQLHPSLASDARVLNLEGTDARDLDRGLVPLTPDLIVCDASFIGLAKILPAALDLAGSRTRLIALVKPQFEAGRQHVGKGGMVKSAAVHVRVIDEVRTWLSGYGWAVVAVTDSPILGGAGAREYLIHAAHRTEL